MKTLIGFALLLVTAGTAMAAKSKDKTLLLVKEESGIQFMKVNFSFDSGSFTYHNGAIQKGELQMDLAGVPLLPPAKNTKIRFTLKKWTELHNFAPGSPNLNIAGFVTYDGKKYPVETKLFYEGKENGFFIHGPVPVKVPSIRFDGEAQVKITAKLSQ